MDKVYAELQNRYAYLLEFAKEHNINIPEGRLEDIDTSLMFLGMDEDPCSNGDGRYIGAVLAGLMSLEQYLYGMEITKIRIKEGLFVL